MPDWAQRNVVSKVRPENCLFAGRTKLKLKNGIE